MFKCPDCGKEVDTSVRHSFRYAWCYKAVKKIAFCSDCASVKPDKNPDPDKLYLVDHVSVCSGTVLIRDPCVQGSCVVIEDSFGGDGSYPVYTIKDDNGTVREVRIIFNER